ncbi:hypothetical protein [Merismopedia glauca]|uniref:Nucleotidyl transferase AbiEii/AbiGii toxin family protein n=1 Tax=Merismopedia glauca CCAP 1448/3 TaxID=1296344 RepID=A0A2T1BZI1_9CYAN|nr:hypothetical protein [Merismopedia glauca]PSB01402.1 hypothetical protein C7B64_18610 [Merismopedia glauca CCAP 1448/3]
MEKLTPEDLRDIFLQLQAANLDAVVVGGQAVNLWAVFYSQRCPQLLDLLPFASEDLDFYGGKVEAIICRDALQGKANLNTDFEATPNSGVVLVNRQDRVLRIDFLANVYGLNDSEITGTAVMFSGTDKLAGINIKVLNPVLCLEGKLKCLLRLPQGGRQDLKHVKMSVLCVKELLKDVCVAQESRAGLKLVERVLSNTLREDALSAWYCHQVAVESAIPIDAIAELADEKWVRFTETRLPQIQEQIELKRQKYRVVMEQIELKRQRSRNEDRER